MYLIEIELLQCMGYLLFIMREEEWLFPLRTLTMQGPLPTTDGSAMLVFRVVPAIFVRQRPSTVNSCIDFKTLSGE